MKMPLRPACRGFVAATLIVATVVAPVRTTHAASAIAGALEPTQLANFIQLIEHSVRFAKMVKQGKEQVESWNRTLKSFRVSDFNALLSLVRNVSTTLKQFRSIAFGARSSLDDFKRKHPGYAMPKDAKQDYVELDRETMAMQTRALEQMDLSTRSAASDVEFTQKLQDKMQGVDGEVKGLQVVAEFLAHLNVQISKLTALLATHAASMETHVANELQRRNYQAQVQKQAYKRTPPRGNEYDWTQQALRGFSGGSYTTSSGRTVQRAPAPGGAFSSSSSSGSAPYQTPDGRTVVPAPAPAGGDSSGTAGAPYQASNGRTIVPAPAPAGTPSRSSSSGVPYQTPEGRTVVPAPAPAGGGSSGAAGAPYQASNGRTVVPAPPPAGVSSSSSPSGTTYQAPNGRTVVPAPAPAGAPTGSGPSGGPYQTPSGRTVVPAPAPGSGERG